MGRRGGCSAKRNVDRVGGVVGVDVDGLAGDGLG